MTGHVWPPEDEDDEKYWARQISPEDIRIVNWSRRRKRSKKLWRTTAGRSGGTVGVVDIGKARDLFK